jgi:hypothetical protein
MSVESDICFLAHAQPFNYSRATLTCEDARLSDTRRFPRGGRRGEGETFRLDEGDDVDAEVDEPELELATSSSEGMCSTSANMAGFAASSRPAYKRGSGCEREERGRGRGRVGSSE